MFIAIASGNRFLPPEWRQHASWRNRWLLFHVNGIGGIGSGLLGRGRFSGCDGGLPLLAHQIRSVRYCRVSYATSELFIQEWPTHVTGTRRSHRLHRVNYHELPLCPMAGIDVTRDHWVPCPTNLLRARTSPVLAFLLSERRREKKEQNNIF